MMFSWLTLEVGPLNDPPSLGQKRHLVLCDASWPPAAPTPSPAWRGISHDQKEEQEEKLCHMFSFFYLAV